MENYINDFLSYLTIERQCSPLTIRDYAHYLKVFSTWLKKNYPALPIEDLTISTIHEYRLYLAKRSYRGTVLKKPTQNYYIICLRSFLKFLLKNDIKTLEPSKIELPRAVSRSPKFLQHEEMMRLLQMPNLTTLIGLRDRTLLELLYSTGLRVSELQRLNKTDINLQTGEFSVRGKGNKIRLVFISDEAAKYLQRYIAMRSDTFSALFISYGRNYNEDRRLTVRHIEQIVTDYVAQADLKVKATPHTLRHSFATDLLNNGANIREVQELLGHASIATTQIYTHVTNDQLREAHKRFHNVERK